MCKKTNTSVINEFPTRTIFTAYHPKQKMHLNQSGVGSTYQRQFSTYSETPHTYLYLQRQPAMVKVSEHANIINQESKISINIPNLNSQKFTPPNTKVGDHTWHNTVLRHLVFISCACEWYKYFCKKEKTESSKGTSSQPSHLITSYAECIGKIVDEQYIANFTL